MKELMESFGKLITVLLMLVLISIIGGFVIKTMWEWFVSPVFGLPSLTIGYAIGLMFIVDYLRKSDLDIREEKPFKESIIEFFVFVFKSLLALIFGWIVTLFI